MHDPTKSRYRHLHLRNKGIPRRFLDISRSVSKETKETPATDIPAHGTYGALLFRPEWRERRKKILERDRCCVVCRATDSLQVHHRQYHFVVSENRFRLPWNYPDWLLITLCEHCHKRGHSKYQVPTINV